MNDLYAKDIYKIKRAKQDKKVEMLSAFLDIKSKLLFGVYKLYMLLAYITGIFLFHSLKSYVNIVLET